MHRSGGPWVWLPLREALERAARLLAESAWRRGILRVPLREARGAVLAALEVAAREAGFEGGYLQLRKAASEGFQSMYIPLGGLRPRDDIDDITIIIAFIGPSGTATAAVFSLLTSSDLSNLNPVGGLPVNAPLILEDESWNGGRRLVCCRVKDAEQAISQGRGVVARAVIEGLEALQRASGEEGCDADEILRGLGWEVREAGGRLEAFRRVEGDEEVVALVGDGLAGAGSIVDAVASSTTAVEACGRVVRLRAEARVAQLVSRLGICSEARRRASLSLGGVRLDVEARGPALACYACGNVMVRLTPPSHAQALTPLECCGKGASDFVQVLAGGPARLQASIEGYTETIRLPYRGLLHMILEPIQAQVAAVASPSGGPTVIPREKLGAIEVLDPGC